MSAAGEWLTLGSLSHECAKPDAIKIERAGALAGALWQCAECGLIWELGQEDVVQTTARSWPDQLVVGQLWIWTKFQQAESWGGDR
jgi:hypothetical protein